MSVCACAVGEGSVRLVVVVVFNCGFFEGSALFLPLPVPTTRVWCVCVGGWVGGWALAPRLIWPGQGCYHGHVPGGKPGTTYHAAACCEPVGPIRGRGSGHRHATEQGAQPACSMRAAQPPVECSPRLMLFALCALAAVVPGGLQSSV